MEAPTNGRDVWTRWLAWTTAADVGGFPAPGVVGVSTSSRAGTAQLLPLAAAGQWLVLRECSPDRRAGC